MIEVSLYVIVFLYTYKEEFNTISKLQEDILM